MGLTDEQLDEIQKWLNEFGHNAAIQALLDEVREWRAADEIPSEWEAVWDEGRGRDVRRLRVSGGWLYQVETCEAWHPPVFVPARLEFLHSDGSVTP